MFFVSSDSVEVRMRLSLTLYYLVKCLLTPRRLAIDLRTVSCYVASG